MQSPQDILQRSKSSQVNEFFICLASKAKKMGANPFKHLSTETKHFSDHQHISSKVSLERALKALSEIGKSINLVGKGEESDMYDPSLLLSTLGKEFKNLPCILNENHLIVDFKKINDAYQEPIGVRVFEVCNGSDKNDMIRRSKD